MAIIKTLKESKIVSKDRPRQTIYPVTSSDAVIVPNKGKLTDALSKVAFSNDYNDLDNLPAPFDIEIPTNISAFNNDVGYLTSFTETDPTVPSWAKQSTKPSYSYNEISGTPTLASVATSGSYNDLSNKPSIPAAQVQSNWNESDTSSKAYIQNKPTIPTVPTNVSAFTNDAGYLTSADLEGVTNDEVDAIILSATQTYFEYAFDLIFTS